MFFLRLKRILVFSVVAAGTYFFILSCDNPNNPFSANLGSKVDVEPPIVEKIVPVSGAYLKGVATFTGQAKAFREVRNVEVRIYNPDESSDKPFLLDWTPLENVTGDKRNERQWSYKLDTLNAFSHIEKDIEGNDIDVPGLDDGFLKIQFRANDSNPDWGGRNETLELVYIIKNKPSVVKMTAPDNSRLVTTTGEVNLDQPATIGTNSDLLGNIIDRRGIKPGYPQIKFWPHDQYGDKEPADDDPNWGWAQLFLSSIDDAEIGEGFYADRAGQKVVNAANFVLRLSKYTIDPVTRQIKYDRSSGDFQPLETGLYRFRIKTYETFFNDDVNSNKYMFPIPVPEGQEETRGDYPALNSPAYAVSLVTTGVRPNVELNNEDLNKTDAELKAMEPHQYITEPTAKKILVREPDPAADALIDFRLRVMAAHPDGIERAILQWEHTGATFRTGYLKWEDIGTSGYVNNKDDTTRAEEGHKGVYKDAALPLEGTIFQFTAINGMKDAGGNVIFTSSTEPYTLKVLAFSKNNETWTEQKYTLYLDAVGPEVALRSVRGAFSGPEGSAQSQAGGTVNDSHYTVNGNIQVSVVSSANMGLMTTNRDGNAVYPVVKWIVEEDKTGYLTADDTILARIKKFRANPGKRGTGAADDFLQFFNGIDTTAKSGWVRTPVSNTDPNWEVVEDETSNIRLNVSQFQPGSAPQYVWLYVIAQDSVYNLGYTAQKLYVDEDSDKPLLSIAGLYDEQTDTNVNLGTELAPNYLKIDAKEKLSITLTAADEPAREKVNVLNRSQGIDLNFSDDDGILPSEITITLVSHNINKTVIITGDKLVGNNTVLREWTGILSQELMARALYDNPATDADESPGYLPDGVYTITINVKDHSQSKVKLNKADEYPASVATGRTIHFAVNSLAPIITITNPEFNNSMQKGGDITVTGTVQSRFSIQKMVISFDPDVISGAAGSQAVPLTLPAVTPNTNGDYVYSWSRTVDLTNTSATSIERRFYLTAWDDLGESSNVDRRMEIDNTPPTVGLYLFNFGRLDMDNGWNRVNGKVPIEVEAYDAYGIGPERAASYVMQPNDEVYIRWFVQPYGSTAPNPTGWADINSYPELPSTDSRTGLFKWGHIRNGRYWAFIDTRGLTEGFEYDVYVIAQDKAGLFSATPAAPMASFKVVQNTDRPRLTEMSPESKEDSILGGTVGLRLTGSIADDDGFNSARQNTYVDIRFPTTVTTDTTNKVISVIAWGGWTALSGTVSNVTGELSYVFDGEGNPYFSSDGNKVYQLRVRDEADRGTLTQGNYNPEGKNPDVATGIAGATPLISRQQIILPGESAPGSAGEADPAYWYQFNLKNTTPEIFFNKYDPDPTHANYSAARPVYAKQSEMHNDLYGWITEVNLATVDVSYRGVTTSLPRAGTNTDEGFFDAGFDSVTGKRTYTWILDASWLNAFNTLNTDGPSSVSIRATDSIGNYTIAEWTFNKDTTGPEVAFDNISDSVIRVVSGSSSIRTLTTTGSGTNSEVQNNTRYYTLANHGLTVGETVMVSNTARYVLWVGSATTGGTDTNSFKLSNNYSMNNPATNVWSPASAAAITLTTTNTVFVAGRFNDIYSELGNVSAYPVGTPSFEYKLYRADLAIPSTWTAVAVTTLGTLDASRQSATWRVAIPGTYDDVTNYDGPYHFQIRLYDNILRNERLIGAGNYTVPAGTTVNGVIGTGQTINTGAPLEFVVDRMEPQMKTKAAGTPGIQLNGASKTALRLTNGVLSENERVFSGAGANGTATAVFTLTGLVYEHNLSKLTADVKNRANTVLTAKRTLVGIDRWAGAWKRGAAGNTAGGTWFKGMISDDSQTGSDYTNEISTPTSIRVRRATQTDLTELLGSATANQERFYYIWELDVTQDDFFRLLNHSATANPTDVTVIRNVTITANDLAGKNSEEEAWPFYIDSISPKVSFSNVGDNGNLYPSTSADAGTVNTSLPLTKWTRLEDTNIRLEGSVSDPNKIQKISYKIEKWNYALATPAFVYLIGDATTAHTLVDNAASAAQTTQDWYLDSTNALYGNSTFAFAGDGLYRLTIMATDWSLSGTFANEGNPPPTTAYVREFYVDRADPAIRWGGSDGSTLGNFYKFDSNGEIDLNCTLEDLNTIDNRTGALSGRLYTFGNTAKAPIGTVTVGYTVTNATTNPGLGKLTVKIKGGNDQAAAAAAVQNGKYTLELTVKDMSGRQAAVEHTVTFYLDNQKPKVTFDLGMPGLSPGVTEYTSKEAIAGRVTFRASVTKDDAAASPIKRVAYKIDNAVPTAPATLDDAALVSGTWFFNNGTATTTTPAANSVLYATSAGAATYTQTGDRLMIIDESLKSATFTLYDTRRFSTVKNTTPASPLLGASGQAANDITYSGIEAANRLILGNTQYRDANVNQLRIHVLAIDEAGNYDIYTFNYWVYPAGDYPSVTITSPDPAAVAIDRRLNGTITISGKADDNYRVGRVWFRVLKDGGPAAGDTAQGIPANYEAASLTIPNWNETTWREDTGNQPGGALTLEGKNFGSGWYIANRGGNANRNITWWAQINTKGELDPTGTADSRDIIIQVMAEDTAQLDDPDQHLGARQGFASSSVVTFTAPPVAPPAGTREHARAQATVVVGAPTFDSELLKTTGSTEWKSVLNSAVKGTDASYQVTVKHLNGVGEIRWTNAPAGVTSTENLLPAVGETVTWHPTTGAIRAKAEPKNLITSGTLAAGTTYMIWEPPTTKPANAATNNRYVIFTATGSDSAAGGSVLRRQSDLTYEWLVTFEFDTTTLVNNNPANTVTNYTNRADYYFINLQALDNSKGGLLAGRKTAQIPIDNLAPNGSYTLNTNVVGTGTTFGGIADDGTSEIKGIERVILWFTRDNAPMVWNDRVATGDALNFNNGLTELGATPNATVATIDKYTVAIPSYVVLPRIPAEDYAGDNNSFIVIDRHDPLGNQTHHGHKLAMGLSDIGNDTTWYVGLNSRDMKSGRVIAHFIVYDTAGNGTYNNMKLMILNDVPKISKITLATNILGDTSTAPGNKNLNTTAGLGTGGGNRTSSSAAANSALDKIKAVMGGTNLQAGIIAEPITVDTSKPGIYNVVVDQKDFMVRNGLFAVKVETDMAVNTGATRNYRVEYVNPNAVRTLTGFGATGTTLNAASTTASQAGIRAGKMYMINHPGYDEDAYNETTGAATQLRFPWAALGASTSGDNFKRGTVFLAMIDGSELIPTTTATATTNLYGTGNDRPSVWELNGTYYTGNAAAANLLTRGGTNLSTQLQFTTAGRIGTDHTIVNNDVQYAASAVNSRAAEFVYRSDAFGTADNRIKDFVADNGTTRGGFLDALGRPKPYPANIDANENVPATAQPWNEHSLFIIRIFDGAEDALFGDFALLSVRVNNNDVTPPYAQLYDLNPKAEGMDKATTQAEALKPESIGANRTMGGLYNTGTVKEPAKSGHIEPRGVNNAAPGTANRTEGSTSLTAQEMGGADGVGSLTRPVANTGAYFAYDTVSGEVIVRGYAEDNQRVARVDLQFFSSRTSARLNTVTILTQGTKSNNGALQAASDRVNFTEEFDLNRHRVEWSYLWPTEEIPGGNYIVGTVNVRAIAYNANSTIRTTADNSPIDTTATPNQATLDAGDRRVHTSARIALNTLTTTALRNTYNDFNPGFESTGNFYRYNDIVVNTRPYITGFLRNSGGESAHNIRSRQGWYILRRGETAVVTGFNLRYGTGNTGVTVLTLGGATIQTAALRTNTDRDNYVVNPKHRDIEYDAAPNTTRYRIITTAANGDTAATIPATAVTGSGLVTLTVNNLPAVNTGNGGGLATADNNTATNSGVTRWVNTAAPVQPRAIQPWNKEYSAGISGSELWDDFTQVHIWQSNADTSDTNTTNYDRSRFVKGDFNITNPSMSIDPVTGTLWASHQEGGRRPTWTGGNNNGNTYPGGGTYISNNNNPTNMPFDDPDQNFTANNGLRQVGSFSEHMTYTNMFVDESQRPWAIANSITKYTTAEKWTFVPGMWLWGPIINDPTTTGDANYNNGNPRVSHFPKTYNGANVTGNERVQFRLPRFNSTAYTGLYMVESLWYNGGTNSRSISTPQSTEQFHNPHIVTNKAGTYVHVSYYDSKDGSLKYRYNQVGDARGVGDEQAPRLWVNLDGGADVDDNSTYNATINTDTTGNEPYAGGAEYTRSTASTATLTGTGTFTPSDTNSYIREVLVQNGAYVTANQKIYAVGNVAIADPVAGYITANTAGFIVLNYRAPVASTNDTNNWSANSRPGANAAVFRIYPATGPRIYTAGRSFNNNAGRYNSIAVTSSGSPVIAYYDETSQALKMAYANATTADWPTAAGWTVLSLGTPRGVGAHVSLQVDDTTYHIAAQDSVNKNVVYVSGTVGSTPTTVQIVDKVGNVGSWCKISLDKDGNPWIAYMDDGYRGSKDGAKVAFLNKTRFYKGGDDAANNRDRDDSNKTISGWEAMHVPTRYRVENDELGMERFPTKRLPDATRPTTTGTFASFAAVGYLGEDYYRIAYYVE